MSTPTPTFFWHDYETSGADKQRDRPLQFAGIRTTLDLIPVGDPVMIYCKVSPETLPHPTASLITGLTPQECMENGMGEANFAHEVLKHLGQSGTCGVGYNSIRFDDEITRNLLYRNFHDPYEREWKYGNSRWDIIDLVRMCYALRPDGIEWPRKPDGSPSFRLEDMAKANGLKQERAHDALSDVEATIQLAQLIRDKQPSLFDYYFNLRRKEQVIAMVDMVKKTPLIHVSSFYPAERGCTTAIIPLAFHPTQSNNFIAYDLMADPEPLLNLGLDELIQRVFQVHDPENPNPRLPLMTIAANKSPALVPPGGLKSVNKERIGLDLDLCRKNHGTLMAAGKDLAAKVQRVFGNPPKRGESDPETSLYGGFPNNHDKQMMEQVRRASPQTLATQPFVFQSPNLNELLFRYRARNWPETLSDDESQRWEAHRRERLIGEHPASSLNLDRYRQSIGELRELPEHQGREALFDSLDAWGKNIQAEFATAPRPKP